ncbi:MAG TPA: glycine cleavage T C-terminal barrel domain-containing protein [Pirellulales bacterium]|nr:glycine cleavage T C-terminal barrel domain-containing protein [Pirellulales bacterium]
MTTNQWRLPPPAGAWIDRARLVRFRFEGRAYTGFAGDTITSALAAHGVRLLGRSFKYHRPRGLYSLANHDVNVLVAAAPPENGDSHRAAETGGLATSSAPSQSPFSGGETNIRADVTPIWEGAELTAVNTFGGLEHDRVRFIDRFSRFLPVGFYYKTFHNPRRMFPFWERRMRAMAGLGAIDLKAPRLRTPKSYAWCEMAVVGAGPAGLAAAVAAAEQGLRVTLVDEHPHAGGSLLYQGAGRPRAQELLRSLLDRARALANLELRTATLAAGYYADHWLALVDGRGLTKLRAESVVLATGALEQPAIFGNNDLPGVVLASAAQRLLRLYAVKPFERPVVLAANADGYRAALDLRQAGIDVRMIVDLRREGEPTDVARQVAEARIAVRRGHAVCEAHSGGDADGVEAVTVCPLDHTGQPRLDQAQRVECDGLAMSVGWAPADSLFCQARGKMRYAKELEQFVPGAWPQGLFTAGRLNGVYDLEAQVADGRRAALAAAAGLGRYSGAIPPRPSAGPPSSHPFPVVEHAGGKTFLDLDEDVQLKDVEHAVQEGFDGVELLKRYSTFGMGPSQGKIANTNTVRVLSRLRGEEMGQSGSPTARPFYHPVPMSHLAGRSFHPRRGTPLHSRHAAAGATFMPAGDWLRPAYYGANPHGREQAIASEVQSVRQGVGLIDVGTLGKLAINGPDAAEFLERIYTGRFAKMKSGTTRYGLMCDEAGVIIDDGVIGRLADDRFYVTTTTTASAAVYRELQRWAIVWRLRVVLANLTGSTAAINLAGPHARRMLAGLCDFDLSEAAFPYLGLREGTVLDVPARLLRTGFVGEVGYEIHLPAHWAARVWDGLLEAGQASQIRSFGVEAQRVLRLEKGHVIVGQDTDGLTTPIEAGMGWAIKADKPFFVGGRSLAIVGRKPPTRRLVGFTLPPGYCGELPKECHLVIERGQIVGRVTSISLSPTLQRVIGLAYVHPSQAAPGTTFRIRVDGGLLVEAKVVETPFYDRKNLRQRI